MTRKQWSLITLSLLLLSIGGVIGAVVLIDPFEIYHQATAFIPPITNGAQNYSNAGIAKSYDYDSVIIGSSMTENFRPSQLDALLGGRFVKLCINSGSPFNHKQMMDLAFSTHDITRVLYGLDLEALTYFYTTPKCEMPEYLYDDNLLNDTAYWFNHSVLLHYIPECLKTLGQSDPDQRDTMYMWGDLYAYGRDAALSEVTITGETVDQGELPEIPELSQQSRLNIYNNLLPFIEEHPDTEFIVFFPPYSLVQWVDFYQKGTMFYHLSQKEAIIRILLGYDNVQVYDFQAELDWVTDLDNYIDAWHYGPWINDAIVERVAAGENRITDWTQARENDETLLRYVEYIEACGDWPEDFSALDAGK